MAVEGADRLAETGPDAVVVDARGHHEDQHLVAVDGPGVDHLDLEGLVGFAVAFPADGPGIHLRRDMTHRRDLSHLVEVLLGGVVRCDGGICIECHGASVSAGSGDAATRNRSVLLQRDIGMAAQ
jgi:hypothetical protein